MAPLLQGLLLVPLALVLWGCGEVVPGGSSGKRTTEAPSPMTTPDASLPLSERVGLLLQAAADAASQQFDCAISLGFKNADFEAAAASGVVDQSSGQTAKISDKFLYGSCTKVATGSSILKLVSQGVIDLDDAIEPLVDPYLAKIAAAEGSKITRLSLAFDEKRLKALTVRRLASMSTGLTDFNTAHDKTDPLREMILKDPEHVISPQDMLKLPWVQSTWEKCKGTEDLDAACYRYSNTNFMLLGLILADKTGAESWRDLNQTQFLPESCQDGSIAFGVSAPPSSATPVHGYDRTKFRTAGEDDFHDIAGEFNGLSAANMMATPQGAARFAYELYGPDHKMIPKDLVKLMHTDGSRGKYGIGTQLGRGITGQSGKYGAYYGHTGTRYGYQSFMQYFPELNLALSGASNIESDHHEQTDAAFCFAYNYVAAALLGQKGMSCEYKEKKCVCSALEGPASYYNDSSVLV